MIIVILTSDHRSDIAIDIIIMKSKTPGPLPSSTFQTASKYCKHESQHLKKATLHPSSISLSNVSFCVPILGTKNVTCLSDGTALRGFQKEHSLIHFLRGLAAPVIWKVRVLCYEFTDVTLAWEDGQWVEAHKIILAGCSPKKAPQPSCLSWMVLILMSRKQ